MPPVGHENVSNGSSTPDQSQAGGSGLGDLQLTFDLRGVGMLWKLISTSVHRLTAARIDTTTFIDCVLVLGGFFEWSDKGRERLTNAVDSNTKLSIDNLLYLGFERESFLKVVCESDQGSFLAALASTLSQCYSSEKTARIMLRLLKLISVDHPESKLRWPALSTLQYFVEKCSSIFSTSEFGADTEELMDHDGRDSTIQSASSRSKAGRLKSRSIADPGDIAAALHQLGKLARKEIQQVNFLGWSDAIAVASIGEWLFDFRVIYLTPDIPGDPYNKPLRKNYDSGEPQIIVLCSEKDERSKTLTKSSIKNLRDISEFLKKDEQVQDHAASGRLRWNRVLAGTFGRAFEQLKGMGDDFGGAIGSAARVFSAIVESQETVPPEWRLKCRTYFPSSYGMSFVQYAAGQLHELQTARINAAMLKNVQVVSFEAAQSDFETYAMRIASVCHCKFCCPGGTPSAGPSHSVGGKRTNSQEPSYGWCLVAVTGTVIRLVRSLSGIDHSTQTGKLLPRRIGIEKLYHAHCSQFQVQRRNEKSDGLFLNRILENVSADKLAPEFSPLAIAGTIFSGKNLDLNIPTNACAVTIGDVCCFINILKDPIHRHVELCSKVCVIPGWIEYDRVTFRGIHDLHSYPFTSKTPLRNHRPPTYCVPEKAKKSIQDCRGGKLILIANQDLLDERPDWLELEHWVMKDDEEVGKFGPGQAVQCICLSSGLVNCGKDGCSVSGAYEDNLKEAISSWGAGEAFRDIEIYNCKVTLFRGDHITSLVAAYTCWEPIYQLDECLACCVRSRVGQGWTNYAIVLSEQAVQSHMSVSTSHRCVNCLNLVTGLTD